MKKSLAILAAALLLCTACKSKAPDIYYSSKPTPTPAPTETVPPAVIVDEVPDENIIETPIMPVG